MERKMRRGRKRREEWKSLRREGKERNRMEWNGKGEEKGMEGKREKGKGVKQKVKGEEKGRDKKRRGERRN